MNTDDLIPDAILPARGTGAPLSANPERRCIAKSKHTGGQCKKAAMKGGRVCRAHGGAAPQVKRLATQRLEDLVDPAIKRLGSAIKQTADLPTSVRASQIVLDRTGHHPKQTIEVEDPDNIFARILGVDKDKLPE